MATMTEEKTFYNPLDRSQIAFIPTDLESINENESINEGEEPIEKAVLGAHSTRASIVPSDLSHLRLELSQSLFSDANPHSFSSGDDELEKLSRVSSGSTRGTNMSHGVRYKIVLKLSAREVKLIRESWSMMLNDEISGNKISTSIRKLINDVGIAPTSQNSNQNRMSSAGSLRGVVASLGNKIRAGSVSAAPQPINTSTIASSLFCSQFYANLLAMDPDLEMMFPSIKHQAIAFAGVLTTAINNLENLSALESYLSDLGKRHARILGIQAMHFELMGMAFLKTIQDRFGVHSTIELEESWSRLYSYLANSILQFGIDPILRIDLEQSVIVFPVPDLIRKTPTTTSSLNPPAEIVSTQKKVPENSKTSAKNIKPSEKIPKDTPTALSAERDKPIPTKATAASKPSKKEHKSSFNGLTKRVSIARHDTNEKECVLM